MRFFPSIYRIESSLGSTRLDTLRSAHSASCVCRLPHGKTSRGVVVVVVVVASAVGVVQLYLDLNDWLAGCGSRIALKLQFQAARKVHVRHYVVVTKGSGKWGEAVL